MKLDVYIKPTHEVVIFPMSCVGAYGVISEDNSIILNMHFPENLIEADLSTVEKELVVTTSKGSFCYPLIKETFELPAEVMSDIVIKLQIKVSAKSFTWKTFPFILRLKEGLDESGDNVYEPVVTAAREECRAELAESLETATGENHDNKTWEELNNTVSTLPITSEEQTQALGDWDLIKAYFADYTGGWHSLFRNAPTDNTGANKEYRLPYIYTPKMAWAENCYISTNLLEFGVDVSSAVNLGGGTNVNTFQPLPKLQKLTLTGNENSPSLQYFMYRNSALRYLKMDTPSEEVLKANPKYYETAFHSCSGLVTVDCELDFTGQTSTKNMFNGCENLRGLRIKPFTLTCSLDVKDCKYFIHPELMDISLISILNAIPNPEFDGQNAGITITYSNECWVLDTMGNGDLFFMEIIGHEVYFNPETKLYSWEKQTENSEKTTLFEAFMDRKGVTLAQ